MSLRRAHIPVLWLLLATSLAAQPIDVPGGDVGLPFSPGFVAGDLVFLSGALGTRPGTLDLVDGVAAQATQAAANLRQVLAPAEVDASRVAAVTVYVADLRYLPAVEAALAEALTGTPAVSAVEADVALADAHVEVAYTAARGTVEAVTPEGWPAPGPVRSWATRTGDTVFVTALTAAPPRPASVADETAAALARLGEVLAAAGLGHRHLAACRVYLPDARHFAAMNEGWRRVLGEAPPVRETVRARLPDAGARVALQCVASAAPREVVAPPGTDLAALPFSPGVLAGDTLYTAGMVGRGPDGYPPSVGEQTRVVLERLGAVLAAAEMTPNDVVDATVYLADVRDYAAMNEVYRGFFSGPPPARATVGTPLMSPEARVEISFRARRR